MIEDYRHIKYSKECIQMQRLKRYKDRNYKEVIKTMPNKDNDQSTTV